MRIQEHHAAADLLEVVLDPEVLDVAVNWKHFLKEFAQGRHVPLTVAELVDRAALRLFRPNLESSVERRVRRLDDEIARKDEQWVPNPRTMASA